MGMEPELYDPSEWPHGLICMDCGRGFYEGMPIGERLIGIGEYAFDPCFVVEKVCVPCGMGL